MFGSSNKYDPNTDIPDLSGKVYVVTGGSAGIGFGICAHLLQHNCAALYILSKKEEHLDSAHAGLAEYGDTTKVHTIQCDLTSLHQTAAVASQLRKDLLRLDALILNAGLGVGPFALSEDGIDTHMQVNVIAQQHLLMTLLPVLVATHDSRLVLQSSEFHRLLVSDVRFDSLQEVNTDIGASKLYARTKLAMVCQLRALARRKANGELGLTPGRAPWINATHPGAVVTDQQNQAVEAYGTMGKLGVKAVRPFMKDPVDEGCRSALFAATAPEVGSKPIDGEYIVPDRKVTEVGDQGKDEELQERLWKLVGGLLREKLGRDLGYEM